MKVGELLERAEGEVHDELEERALAGLKERLREIRAAKLALQQMEKDLAAYKERDVDELVFD